jgi:hypothetical protein
VIIPLLLGTASHRPLRRARALWSSARRSWLNATGDHGLARPAQLCLGAASISTAPRATQGFMDLVAGALIVVDTTWIQAAILAHATSAQYTLVRAIVLASRAGRLARLMRHLNLLQMLHARPGACRPQAGMASRALRRSSGLLLM